MSEVLAPVKSAPTTTPRETFVQVDHSLTEGVLVYRPEDNSFIALYPDEWLACRADGYAKKTAIDELQDANRDVTAKSLALHDLLQQPNPPKAALAEARRQLDEALDTLAKKSEAAKKHVEPIVSQKSDPNKIVELLPLTLKRIEGRTATPIYVNAEHLRRALADKRVHMVEGAAERRKVPAQKLFDGTKLNADEIRKRMLNNVQDKAKFSKKWKWAPKDEEHFCGILTDWAKVMGTKATELLQRGQREIVEGIVGMESADPDNPYRSVDMKPVAQLFRWTAGAGSEANFSPLRGNADDLRDLNWFQRFKRMAKAAQFGLKANGESSFAVGEAKVDTILYLPHAAGWHLDTTIAAQHFDFGYFRLRGDLALFALAGASIILETGVSVTVTGDKQGIKGTPKDRDGVKTKQGAKGEAKIFAGLKEGVGLSGALQWLNPEGLVHSVPKKADLNKAIAAYVDVAEINGDVSAIEGLAAKHGFECDYRGGYFVIAAKASRCLGLGCEANIAAKVGAKQIGAFLMCIAHQLKQAGYKKLTDLMKADAFSTLNQLFYLLSADGREIGTLVGLEPRAIVEMYFEARNRLTRSGGQGMHQLELRLRSGWGWHVYMPPEARGAVINAVIEAAKNARNIGDNRLMQAAAFIINELLATVQSISHLNNTLDRITSDIGSTPGRNYGVQLISSIVDRTAYADCIERCQTELIRSHPLSGRPFLRNDERDFIAAWLPLHHPAYSVGIEAA